MSAGLDGKIFVGRRQRGSDQSCGIGHTDILDVMLYAPTGNLQKHQQCASKVLVR